MGLDGDMSFKQAIWTTLHIIMFFVFLIATFSVIGDQWILAGLLFVPTFMLGYRLSLILFPRTETTITVAGNAIDASLEVGNVVKLNNSSWRVIESAYMVQIGVTVALIRRVS